MEFTVHNLGAIEQARLDMKPLTVLVGPNGVGKTWLAYAYSGIFSPYGYHRVRDAYMEDGSRLRFEPLDAAITAFSRDGSAVLDLAEFADDCADAYFNATSALCKDWLAGYLRTSLVSFDDLTITARMSAADRLAFRHNLRRRRLSQRLNQPGGEFMAYKPRNENALHLITRTDNRKGGTRRQEGVDEVTRGFVTATVFRLMHQSLYQSTRVFPTERAELVTYPPRRMSTRDDDDDSRGVRVSEPIASLMLTLTTAESRASQPVDGGAEREGAEDYRKLAALVEKRVLGGRMTYSEPKPTGTRDLLYLPSETVRLDMPVASSMVKELGSLVLYLRYVAQRGELIVIDEPEINLHPEAQVQLIELLAIMVNRGLRVLITTHSSYMVDHLVNLMQASDSGDRSKSAKRLLLRRQAAILDPRDVAVYLFGNRTARSLIDGSTVDWGTFSSVSDRIANIYYGLQSDRQA